MTNDKTEYDAFMNVLNKIETYFNDSTDENLSEAITLCNELHTQLSNASKYLSPLTEEELAAITEFGMDIYAYDDLFNNFTFFRNIKISALEGLNIQLSEISESQNSLDAIVTFYKEYNRLFQIDMYYNVNHYINECNIEDESVDNFKNNFYPNLINDFSDSMKWEDDNDVIIEISEQLQSNLEDIVNEFTENSNLVGDEISGNE